MQIQCATLVLVVVAVGRLCPGQAEPTPPNLSIQAKPLADVIEGVSGSIAFIRTEEGTGTGFYVNNAGYVVTAKHVVHLDAGPPAKNIRIEWTMPAAKIEKVTIQGGETGVSAIIVAEDQEHDLALLQPGENPFTARAGIVIGGKKILPDNHPAVLCPRIVSLRSGDPIFTIGHPFGDLRRITTSGIIASSQPITIDTSGELRGTYFVDMLINHGNSGGPVFSSSGCVIGVVLAMETAPVEGGGSTHLPRVQLNIAGPDGKPVIENGKPLTITLEYSSGLGILVPQRYVLKLLDSAGFTKLPSPAGRDNHQQ